MSVINIEGNGKILINVALLFFDRISSDVVLLSEFSLGSKALEIPDRFSERGVEEDRRDNPLGSQDNYVARYKPDHHLDQHIPISREVIIV